MKTEEENLQSTIDYYERTAHELVPSYDTADMLEFHKLLLSNLIPESKILDIGFGSGRDISFFKEHGFDVWGIDPSQQFVNLAKKRFSDIDDHFYQGALPDLHILNELTHTFDTVILIAVWMHLPKTYYAASVAKICSLLRPDGKVIISYSITPRTGETERYFEDVDSKLLEELFNANKCTKILESTNEDGLQARPITWKTEVYHYDQS